MNVRKYRWSKHYESAEEELVALLAAKHIQAKRWTVEGSEILASVINDADKRIWCAEGTIIFTVNGKQFSLQPGDTLDLPAGTTYDATAGLFGVACYEAQIG